MFGSNGKEAITRFDTEKEMAKEMIDNEKDKDILYATIVYGKDASVKSKFKDMPDKTSLKKFIDSLTWKENGKYLHHPLAEADKIFKEHGRPEARKVTIVFVTGKVDSTTTELKKAARKLNDNGVKIIVVKLGTDPDDKRLKAITPEKNIVKVKENSDPKKSAKLVDEQRMKGKQSSVIIFIVFALFSYHLLIPAFMHLLYLAPSLLSTFFTCFRSLFR